MTNNDGPITRSQNKRKREDSLSRNNRKKYKKGNFDDSSSESSDESDNSSERDYDYCPSDSESSTSYNSDPISDKEVEDLKKGIIKNIPYDFDYDKAEEEADEEYQKYIKEFDLRKNKTNVSDKPIQEEDYLNEINNLIKEADEIGDEERKQNFESLKQVSIILKDIGDKINVNDKLPPNPLDLKKPVKPPQPSPPPQFIILNKKDKPYDLRPKTNKYNILSIEEQKKIKETEKELFEFNRHKVKPRNKVLLSSMSLPSKAKVIENMNRLENMNSYSSEYNKLSRWIDYVLKVPFDTYYELPISLSSPNDQISTYLSNIENVMEKCIYAQNTAKEKILEFVGRWITNPSSTNEPIAFVGEKGTGKTTLAKEGIAKALGRPFFMVSLGGESDAASFKGHDYTYEGSRWGRIVDILINTQCMNPVIFFDELDKLSTTRAGEEIAGMLMHLTDTTQNDKFSDKYFSGIEFDLSKALFIFSYNDSNKLNPILRDRLTEIKFTSFKKHDKVIIANNFLINRACENIGLKSCNYQLKDDVIYHLIEKYTDNKESGVRGLKRVIETLFLRLNLYQLPHQLNISYKDMKIIKENGVSKITKDIVVTLLKDLVPNMNPINYNMYA